MRPEHHLCTRPRSRGQHWHSSILVICFWSALLGPNLCTGDATAPRITAETLVRYLQQDLFLSPGVGFKKVQIGNTFDHVKNNWGLPNEVYSGTPNTKPGSGEIEKRRWTYVAGRDSEVRISGDNRVKQIEILGSLTAPFLSTEGVGFGMTPHQVISIYGPPTNKGNLQEILYNARGIAFRFELGGLTRMLVFSPGSLSPSSSDRQPVK